MELMIGQIDNLLQGTTSAIDAIRLLVRVVCEHTQSHLVTLRYIQDEKAMLFKIGLENFSDYEKVAKTYYTLSHDASWSVRTIISRQIQRTNSLEVIKERQADLSNDAKDVLKDVKSLFFMPLFFNGQCIGSLGFHFNFENGYKVANISFIKEISERVAGALYDFLTEQKIEDRVKKEKEEFLGRSSKVKITGVDKQIFLSYKSNNKPMVEQFECALKSFGYKVWYDRNDVTTKQTIPNQIMNAIKNSSTVVVFATPDYRNDHYLKMELDFAVNQKIEREDFNIICLCFKKKNVVGKAPDILLNQGYLALGPYDSDLKAFNELLKHL
jgi:hypothetical protein